MATANTKTEKKNKISQKDSSQRFSLTWLDENINLDEPQTKSFLETARTLVQSVSIFFDAQLFLKNIEKEKNPILFIVSGRLAEKVVTRIHDQQHIVSIFIFCGKKTSTPSWMEGKKKVRGVFTDFQSLIKAIENSTRKTDDNDSAGFSIIPARNVAAGNVNSLDSAFLYTYLLRKIISQVEYRSDSRKKLLEFCRTRRDSFKLEDFEKLEREYEKVDPLVWYTDDTSIHRVLNASLREQNFENIFHLGFLINDIDKRLRDLHRDFVQTQEPTITLYRGQGLDNGQMKNPEKDLGGLICFNSFLSTSSSIDVASYFAENVLTNPQYSNSALFKIKVDNSMETVAYASIAAYNKFDEKEVLFSMPTVCRIERIQISKRNPRIYEIDLTLISPQDKTMQKLIQIIEEQIQGKTAQHRLAGLMFKLNRLEQARQIYEKILDEETQPIDKAQVYFHLAHIYHNEGNCVKSLDHYYKALHIYEEKLPADHLNIATVKNNVGLVFDELKKYQEALKFYLDAAKIYEKSSNDTVAMLAGCYNNIASAYDNLQDQQKAINYYGKANQIYEKTGMEISVEAATLHSNLGLCYAKLENKSKASHHLQMAVQISNKVLPKGHPDLQTFLANAKSLGN